MQVETKALKTLIPIITLCIILSACEKKPQQYSKQQPNKKLSLSAVEEEHLFYLQNPFKGKEVTLLNNDGKEVRLAAYNCSVYKAIVKEGIVIKWKNILSPSLFYPFSKCARSTIKHTKSQYVEVFLGKIGFGAGGCCSVSGTYRSKDGINWEERKARGKWQEYNAK